MAELPGARAQLDRDGAWLRAQIRDLAAQLTPEQEPELPARDPVVTDWQEQLRYRHQVTARIERPAELNTPAVIDRAAALLQAAGWQVDKGVTPQEGYTPLVHVTGTREGFRIEVRIQEGYRGVLYTGETAERPLYTVEEFVPPEPLKTSETVSLGHVLCYECNGLGACPLCLGRGWILGDEGRERCRECHGDRVCPVCAGVGELPIASLAKWERDQYPELRNQPSK